MILGYWIWIRLAASYVSCRFPASPLLLFDFPQYLHAQHDRSLYDQCAGMHKTTLVHSPVLSVLKELVENNQPTTDISLSLLDALHKNSSCRCAVRHGSLSLFHSSIYYGGTNLCSVATDPWDLTSQQAFLTPSEASVRMVLRSWTELPFSNCPDSGSV